jgi:diacylglycerol kinase (ATP)
MNKDIVLIVNPNSNGGLTGKNWDSLFNTICKCFGNDIEVAFTDKEGDGTRLTRDYLKKGFKNIIPIGGDGMINESANGFFEDNDEGNSNFNSKIKDDNKNLLPSLSLKPKNQDALMTVLPGGTRNVLIQSLGLPNDFEDCCRILSDRKTSKKIDVIASLVTDSNNPSKYLKRIFLNAAEIGIGAEIISKAKDIRKKVNNRLLSTIAGVVSTIPTYKSATCEISIGLNKDSDIDEKIITKMTMGVIANGKFLGGGVQAATKAIMDDGLLDLLVIRNSDGLAIVNEIINIKIEDQPKSEGGNIYYTQAKNVLMNSAEEKDIIVTFDGEPVGTLPAFFKVFPNYLNIRI